MRSRVSTLIVVLGLGVPSIAYGAPGAGTVADPIAIDALPYAVAGTTVGAASTIERYDCADTLDESGGEVVYAFSLPLAARVSAWVEGDDDVVDIDVHLLSGLDVQAGIAQGCVARGNRIAEAELDAGAYYVVVDTYDGAAQAGAFVLHLDAIGDDWTERHVADGVSWRARRYAALAGGAQVVHLLVVDPTVPGVSIRSIDATGCQTVGAMGEALGAVAGVNGGYFASGCAPVSLLKTGGQLTGTNAEDRGAFGMTSSATPLIDVVVAGADWPAAHEAQGGGPVLVRAGVPRSGSSAWAEESFTSSSFNGRNPRTLAGFNGSGSISFGTVDGRRTNAYGMSLDDLAAWAASADVGLSEAVNLDGGGSTTMWIAGANPNGVVNYPSDDAAQETAAHAGSRGVSGGLFVFASPYNHAPRFQTDPITTGTVGQPYVYDADAIDLDVEDVITYTLAVAPDGMTIDPSSGEVDWTPGAGAAVVTPVTITASDGHGGKTDQSYEIAVEGTGLPDAGGHDAAVTEEASVPEEDGATDGSATDSGGATDSGDASTPQGASGSPASAPQSEEAEGCACRSPAGGRARASWLILLGVCAAFWWRRK